MALKYRIRLSDGRVVGPLTVEEVEELYQKDHISGNEECQLFPVGDWKNIRSFSNLAEHLQKKKMTAIAPEEVVIVADPLQFQEFKFVKEDQEVVDYTELEKKYQETSKLEPEIEKTRVHKLNPVQNIEKTTIDLNRALLKARESSQVTKAPTAVKEKTVVALPTREQLVSEQTQFMDLNALLPSLNTELRAAEVDLEQQEKIEENQERIKEREELEKEEAKRAQKEKPKNKMGMKPVVAIAFAAIIFILLYPDEAPVSVEPIYATVSFPMVMDVEDASKASVALKAGRDAYAQMTYPNRLLASQQFTESLQFLFKGNEALGELILTDAELMDNVKNDKQAMNVIYKLILLSENKTFFDVQVVTGSALFYNKVGKYEAAVNLIKNFFRAKGKPTPKLLAYYLDALIGAGDLPEATKIAGRLNEIQKKPFESYLSLAKYFETDEKPDAAETIIEEGLKVHPKSVPLLLKQADFLLKKNEIDKFEGVLTKCRKLNSENSPAYTAKYYKHMGFLNAAKNKNKDAAAFFKKSLALQESDDLRSVLATLEIKGDKFSQTLILESKIIDLMKKAEVEIKNRNFETASALSVEAVDADPEYAPSVLQHVRIQLAKGLYDAAIFSLNRLLNKQPLNIQVKKMLAETYLQSMKFEDAQKTLVELSKTKYNFTSNFANLMAKFFEGKKNNLLAIRWYVEAIERDPMSDNNMYNLAKIFFKLKKFEDAKKHLSKAMTLDPKNTEYVALQAEILGDQDSSDVALGYLRDTISERGEDPLLVSTIAKTYYQSGQLKEFQNYYKKILAMPKKDEKFFEFLIYASKLEDNKTDFITYSNELLKLNPGNLALQMELAEFYLKASNFKEAQLHLDQIAEKLQSYPRLHFLLAKLAFAQGDMAKAKEMAEKEKTFNPTMELSCVMLGEIAKSAKDYREALNQFEKALTLNPKSADALLAMGSIKLTQNHTSEALELLLLANKYDRNNPEISKQLGFAYRAAGQRSQGRERFEDYLKLNPGASDRDQIESLIRALK